MSDLRFLKQGRYFGPNGEDLGAADEKAAQDAPKSEKKTGDLPGNFVAISVLKSADITTYEALRDASDDALKALDGIDDEKLAKIRAAQDK